MPKNKTHSGAKKRFRVTGSGKLMHAKRNKRHILTKKTPKRKRQLRGQAVLDNTNAAKYVRSVINH